MKKKLLGILLTAVLAVCALTICTSAATTITTADELIEIMGDSTKWAGDYVLGDNINLAEAAEGSVQTPIGTSSVKFTGTFNGNGYKISGLNLSGTTYIGLFGVAEGATIQNLTVEGDVTVTSKYGGGIMGFGRNVNIINCVSKVNVKGPYVGGIVGILNQTTATNSWIFKCVNEGTITGASFSGGIVGQVNQTKASTVIIEGCTNNGTVDGSQRLGGIVGYYTPAIANAELTIKDCVNEKAVAGTGNIVGGILGYIEDKGAYIVYLTIHNCINNGDISAARYAGGIMGCHGTVSINARDVRTTLTNLYNKGTIKSTSTANDGAIIGIYRAPLVTDGAYNVVWSDWHNEGTSARGMVAEVALLAAPFTAKNIYNQAATQMFSTNTSTTSYTVSSNTITLTNSYNSASADLSALAADENWVMSSDSTVGLTSMEKVADTSIDSAEEFIALMNDSSAWGGSYTLTADINLTGYYQKPIGDIVTPFTGSFDGGEHTISGIDISGMNNVGLFGVTRGATIKDLTLKGTVMATGQQVAAVSGLALAPATFENITSEVVIYNSKGKHTGAIAGMIYFDTLGADVTVKNCTNEGEILSGSYSGGIVGIAGSVFNSIPYIAEKDVGGNDLTITGCVNRGNITTDTGNVVGGIMGYYMYRRGSAEVSNFKILKSANYGAIDAKAGDYVGGIIGAVLEKNHGNVNQAYVTIELAELLSAGTIAASSTTYMGSLVGLLRVPVITDGVAPTSVHDCWSTSVASYGMVGRCGAAACSWNAYNLYNKAGTYIIGKQTVTSGAVTLDSNTVTLTNCFNSASADADALAGLVTTNDESDPSCVWVNRFDLPELKEFAQAKLELTLDNSIDSAEELILLMNSPDRWAESYTLSTDINLDGLTLSPIGASDNKFTGTFDGAGFTISNMNMTGATGVGLFGYAENITIRNLNVTNATVNGTDSVAVLIGSAGGTITIENCNINGHTQTTGARVALLVGDVPNAGTIVASVKGCTTSGSVHAGTGHAGALFGRVYGRNSITVENCTNNASVTADTIEAGGLIGRIPITTHGAVISITGCTNTGNVTANSESAGGFVGELQATANYTITVSGCTNTGEIVAETNYAGGIFGFYNNYYDKNLGYAVVDANFTGNKNEGKVNGGVYVGGLMGYVLIRQNDTEFDFTDSENRGEIVGGVWAGGLIGRLHSDVVTADTVPTKAISASNLRNYGAVHADKTATTNTDKGKYAGGIFGFVTTTAQVMNFDNLYNEGDVTADTHYAGGITSHLRSYGNNGTGNNTATNCLANLSNAENRGTITNAGSHTGGIVGLIANIAQVTVRNSVNSGVISGSDACHAIVGTPDGLTTVNHIIENCFYSSEVEDPNATKVAADTDFSALSAELWTVPVSGKAYAPELSAYHDPVIVATEIDKTTHSLNCWCGRLETTTEAHTFDENGACTKCTYADCIHTIGEVVMSYDAERAAIVYTRACCESELYVDTALNTTVYVDSTVADLAANATVTAPIDTFKNFEVAMQYAAYVANVKGNVTIVIKDVAQVNTPKYQTPVYEGMITITGDNGTQTKGNLYFNIDGTRRWYANGDVTFEKLSFTSNAKDGVKIYAQNHTMVFGTGITMDNSDVVYKSNGAVDIGAGFANGVNNVKMYVHGGFESNNSQPMNTNITVRSGDYWFIGGWSSSTSNFDNCGTGSLTVGKQDPDDYLFSRYLVGYSTGAQELTAASEVTITVDGEFNCEFFFPGTQNDIASNKDVLYRTNLYLKGNMNSEANETFAKFDVAGTTTTTNTMLDVYVDCTNAEALKDSYLILGGDPSNNIAADPSLGIMKTKTTLYHIGNTYYVWDKIGSEYVVRCSLCASTLISQTEVPTIYVGEGGTDYTYGLTSDTRFGDLGIATGALSSVGGTIKIIDYLTISGNTYLCDWGDNTITFTTDSIKDGVADGGLYITTKNVQLTLGGKAIFDTFALKGTSSSVGNVIINAMWNDVTFTRIHSVDYGCCYLMAGQWGATESDTTPVTQTINVEGHTTNTARAYFFGRIYMGSEMQAKDIDISNKNITLNLNNGYANVDATERTKGAQVNTLYTMSTTGSDAYATANASGCISTVNFDGDMTVYNFRTGDRNVDRAASTASLGELYLNFMGNSNIDNSAVIRNCYETFITVSNEEEGRTKPLAHSFFFSGKGTFVDADAEVSVTYGTHSFVSAIAYPPVTLDYDGDGVSYKLISNDFANECEYTSEITTEPGETTFGVRTYTCECGRSYTEPVCGTYAHKYVQDAPGVYVCELCGDISDTLLMPDGSVLITAAASTIKDGKVTVDIIFDADAFAASQFTVAAPAGFTLESVADADDSFDLYYTEQLTLPCQFMLINLSATNAAVANAKVATLTFAVDSSVFTEDGEIVITNVETIDENEEDISYVVTVNATVSSAHALEMNVKYGLSVILKGDFRLEYLVQTAETVDTENAWIEIEGVDEIITPHTVTVAEDGTTTLRFLAPDIAAKEMNDAIYYSFHTKVDGVEYAGSTTSRNLVDYYNYAKDYFAPYAGQGQVDSMMNLMYTMLNYGAAAQTYFEYNTDALVNEHLDADKRVDYTGVEIEADGAFEVEAPDNPDDHLYSANEVYVTLEQDVVLTIKFVGSNITEESVKDLVYKGSYVNYAGETINVTSDKVSVEDGVIRVDIDNISPKDFREDLVGGRYNGETLVSTTVTASVEAYVSEILAGDYDEAFTAAGHNVVNLKAVCKALLAYSDAAKDLFYRITVNPVEK